MNSVFKVSIIIPVYNAEKFIRKSVESVVHLKETGEVILVEDGSPDNALEVCKLLEKEYEKVRLLQHPDKRNHGAAASRNLGIVSAKCDYIAFLDADDYYLPNRFLKDKEILLHSPEIDGVYNALGINYYTEKGKKQFLDAGFKTQEFYTVNGLVKPEELFFVLFNQHPKYSGEFHGNTLTVRKKVFSKTGLFNTEINIIEDTHLWRRMAAVCKFAAGNITEAVAIRGVHDENRMVNEKIRKENQKLWWIDLHNWLKKEKVKKEYRKCFEKCYLNYKIKQHGRFKKTAVFIKYYLKHPSLIFSSNSFDYQFFETFGRNWTTLHTISFKNKIFK